MFVPAATIRRVWRLPSVPVMPWTSTLLFSVRKIAMAVMPLAGQCGGEPSRAVHRVFGAYAAERGLGEDPPPFRRVVAVQPDDQGFGDRLAPAGEQPDRLDDAVGDGVAGGDPAEHVDEDAAYRGIAEDDLQTVRHHLGRGSAADVEEVGRFDAAVLLAGAGHHVEGAHHQPGAVADHADLAVELDVVQVPLGGGGLEWVGGADVDEPWVSGLAEAGVVVEGHLAVQRSYRAVGEAGQWVDLDECGVLLAEHRPEADQEVGHVAANVGRQGGLGGQSQCALPADSAGRVHLAPGQRVRCLGGDLFDVDTALGRGQGEEGAAGAVEEQRYVVLVDDLAGLGDQDLADGVSLDVHAQDRGRDLACRVRAVGQPDAAGLAPAAGPHLCLDHHTTAELGGGCPGLVWGGGDAAPADRYAVLGEEFLRLVLQQIHLASFLSTFGR
ncbi:hypothetical protein Pflav_032300 [Phytohabitans flavus]|uniref:Uncharacterized protein n=1 Tax=Phytohabitans flavus TaxID=1076124 RepID=A0A6F8XSM6_9ACTN|nr:hypothetical protein Pflav_032300 [Phytohabitans flavus]